MKKICMIIILIIGVSKILCSQTIIIINEVEGGRPLTLDDFKGIPPDGSTVDGNTNSTIGYTFKDMNSNTMG